MFSAIERGLANTGKQAFEVSALVFRSQRLGNLRVTLAALGRFAHRRLKLISRQIRVLLRDHGSDPADVTFRDHGQFHRLP
jgi:2'-5' RNA ligase